MDSNTHFRNRLKRVIYQSARSGGYFVKKADGTRYYKPVAAYHVANANAPLVKLTRNHSVPASLMPSRLRGRAPAAKTKGGPRKVRKNKGGIRMTEAKAYQMIFNTPMPPKKRRVAKPKHTGMTPRHASGRKIRKNAGVKRVAKAAPSKYKKIPLRIFKRSNPFAALNRVAK